jgi:hypothetical protein
MLKKKKKKPAGNCNLSDQHNRERYLFKVNLRGSWYMKEISKLHTKENEIFVIVKFKIYGSELANCSLRSVHSPQILKGLPSGATETG